MNLASGFEKRSLENSLAGLRGVAGHYMRDVQEVLQGRSGLHRDRKIICFGLKMWV